MKKIKLIRKDIMRDEMEKIDKEKPKLGKSLSGVAEDNEQEFFNYSRNTRNSNDGIKILADGDYKKDSLDVAK